MNNQGFGDSLKLKILPAQTNLNAAEYQLFKLLRGINSCLLESSYDTAGPGIGMLAAGFFYFLLRARTRSRGPAKSIPEL
ncbi:MAG: hypothetical protein ACO1O1_16700 [Adhaeribacter sp.]